MLPFVEIEQWNRNATSRSRCQVLDDTGFVHRDNRVFYVYCFGILGRMCLNTFARRLWQTLGILGSVLHGFVILMTLETPAASSRGGISNK